MNLHGRSIALVAADSENRRIERLEENKLRVILIGERLCDEEKVVHETVVYLKISTSDPKLVSKVLVCNLPISWVCLYLRSLYKSPYKSQISVGNTPRCVHIFTCTVIILDVSFDLFDCVSSFTQGQWDFGRNSAQESPRNKLITLLPSVFFWLRTRLGKPRPSVSPRL